MKSPLGTPRDGCQLGFGVGRLLVTKLNYDLSMIMLKIGLLNPETNEPACFEGKVLPFGSTASVVHFNRCSRLLQHIGWHQVSPRATVRVLVRRSNYGTNSLEQLQLVAIPKIVRVVQ